MRRVHRKGREVDVDQLRGVRGRRAGAALHRGPRARWARRSRASRAGCSSSSACVGAKLVVRTPAGVVLTSAGERFLAHAERALASIDAGRTAIEELSGEPRGTVALGQPADHQRVRACRRCSRASTPRNPEVVLKLREGLADQIEERLASGELDLALMNLPVRRLDLAAQKLWQEDYLLAVPAGASPGVGGSRRHARRRRRASRSSSCRARTRRRRSWPRARRGACGRAIVVDADNLEAVRRMVERGLGVALLPRTMAEATDARRVRTLELARGGVRRQVALVHRGEAFLTAAARALRATIVEVTAARRARPR